MHTTDNVADRQTHSDRGIGPVLGQHCGQHCGGIWPIQYNTMEFNTQYNTIFLLIKSSLFQYSVIFSDICGRNAVIFSDIRRDIQWYSVTSVEGMFVCVFCCCLFRLVFMFVLFYVYVCFYVLFLSLCLGLKTLKKWCWESVSERRLADLIDVTLVSEDESCLLVKIVNWRKLSIDEGWTSLRSDSLWRFACGDVISTVRYSILH